MDSKIYMEEMVVNKDRKFGSNKTYFPAIIEHGTGNEVRALFTEKDIQSAVERAVINPEDFKEKQSLLDRLFGR